MQCRVTTEDPENNFIPDYGRITAYRSPAGFGIRLDAGTAYSGAIITRSYDSLLVKVTAWSPTPQETIARMHRALWEFRVRGVVTNLRFLDQLIMHPRFATAEYTTKFIDETPELFRFPRKRDRATRLLNFIGDVIVNGNPRSEGPAAPARGWSNPKLPKLELPPPPPGTKQKLDELGRRTFAAWMLRAEARAADGHDDARCAPVAARDAHPHARHGGDRAVLREPAAGPVLGRVLGRRDVRRRDALPQRMSVGAPARVPRGDAEPAAADAAALGERGRLHELSRQRRALLRASRRRRPASICSASSIRSTGSRTCASRSTRCARPASCARRRSATPAISPIRARRSTTSSTT